MLMSQPSFAETIVHLCINKVSLCFFHVLVKVFVLKYQVQNSTMHTQFIPVDSFFYNTML